MSNSKTKCIDCKEFTICEKYKPVEYFLPYDLNLCSQCIALRKISEDVLKTEKDMRKANNEPPVMT